MTLQGYEMITGSALGIHTFLAINPFREKKKRKKKDVQRTRAKLENTE